MAWTDYRAAPPPGTPVCAAARIEGVLALSVQSAQGALPLLLARTPLGLRAYVNACPHQYLPLDYRGPQVLSACGGALLCTAHGARFDIATGAALAGADCGLDPVPLEERDGIVFIAG
ncbi:Rieske 2Fe-2S domain-containing protein [Pseudooceanicola sp. CBS1P-1]|uniref:Rieske 2Fe-2S domain-containing protein n=1 Tax=Pseudooceanicola albus TaxID=2692189 RepID=A0A6L7G5Q9_9RHOB|nr:MULTISPECIES: Rieske 2Fe-2S domain-containing protein [Pseudooceanicola]MBT9385284.1 Rieske 2Fe-2S domain-containing protein [Pseudooceanicola endophyticus]MXN18857.1 Rieske 2Fe-2S domain-containing protein [Pseudooceanicola albus]